MNQGLIPRRYAKALFKFALERNTDARIYELMGRLADSFSASRQLQQAVSNPFVSNGDKMKLLIAAAGATPADEGFADFLKLLVNNNRLDMMHGIAIAYREIYRQAHDIYVVHVTSASPLDTDEESRLKTMIRKHLNGGKMEYSLSVNPDLIGGFVININNERLDASVANELEQLRQKLLSN